MPNGKLTPPFPKKVPLPYSSPN